MKRFLLKIIFVIFCIIFISCLVYIIRYERDIKKGEQQIDDLKQKIQEAEEQEENQNNEDTEVSEKKKTEATESIKNQNTKQNEDKENNKDNNRKEEEQKNILNTYKKIHEENKDMVGWIKIKGTTIDYPVMWTPNDSLYYLHRNWKKEESLAGLPLIDGKCTLDSNNTIIYSHNMKNGSMFGALKKYKKKQFYEKNPVIQFDTIYETGKYQIIAVLLTEAYYEKKQKETDFVFYNYTNLDNEETFTEYIKHIKNLSLYNIEETAKYGDKLITLCTCHYHTENGRLLVVAKKIK